MKTVYYFPHDYNARNDPKIQFLIMKMWLEWFGIYRAIIEMLYEQEWYIELSKIESIAFALHTECERIANVIHNYNLFIVDWEKFYSNSVLSRINIRKEKSDLAKKSAEKRRSKYNNNANALHIECERNAINKIKENKIKEKEINKIKYKDCVLLTEEQYISLLDNYWERNTNEYIQKLNNFIMSKWKKYKSHYHTILNWMWSAWIKIKQKKENKIKKEEKEMTEEQKQKSKELLQRARNILLSK